MTVQRIDHFTVCCAPVQQAAMTRFYGDLLGLAEGPRPPFTFPGQWLYLDGHPLVHIAAIAAEDAPAGPATQATADRSPIGGNAIHGGFDHVALRLRGLETTRERLRRHQIAFNEQPVPGLPLLQLFVVDPAGTKLELAFDLLDEAPRVPPQARQVAANGTQVALTVRGSGPPLLLLHGGEADHAMFDALGDALSARHTVIAYDQRDCGDTVNPATPYTLDDMADDAAALIEALGYARCDVHGTSLGGLIAQTLAARHPQRVDRLVLGSTWRAGRSLADVSPAVAPELMRLRADPAANAAAIAAFFFPPVLLALRPTLSQLFGGSKRTVEQRTRRAALVTHPPQVDLSRVTAPTLLLAGADDRLIPNAATFALASEIRDSRTQALPGIGHVGALQAPLEVAAAIDAFLQC